MEVKEELQTLIKQYGKGNVRKAVESIFSGRDEAGDKKRKEIAARLIESYPGDGSITKMENNIVKLLKRGVTEETLGKSVEQYSRKLIMKKRMGKPIPFEFVYKGHNFFAPNGYWRDFV